MPLFSRSALQPPVTPEHEAGTGRQTLPCAHCPGPLLPPAPSGWDTSTVPASPSACRDVRGGSAMARGPTALLHGQSRRCSRKTPTPVGQSHQLWPCSFLCHILGYGGHSSTDGDSTRRWGSGMRPMSPWVCSGWLWATRASAACFGIARTK